MKDLNFKLSRELFCKRQITFGGKIRTIFQECRESYLKYLAELTLSTLIATLGAGGRVQEGDGGSVRDLVLRREGRQVDCLRLE